MDRAARALVKTIDCMERGGSWGEASSWLIGARAWGLHDRPTLSANAAQGWISYVAHPKWATLFLSGEWLLYEPGEINDQRARPQRRADAN